MDKPDFSNKCYKTKDDHRHSTIFIVGGDETQEEFNERIKNLRENKGTYVWDEEKKCVVRKEEYKPKEIDAPKVSLWQDEWSVVATGRRMSKGQLKEYCKINGKVWDNA